MREKIYFHAGENLFTCGRKNIHPLSPLIFKKFCVPLHLLNVYHNYSIVKWLEIRKVG